MGKDKVLDAAYKEVTSYELQVTSIKKMRLLLVACYSLLLAACSMPRIIVLDDPLSPEEHINLGVVYEKKGEFESAIKEYEAASKKLPVAYLYLGNVYFQKKELGEAEEYYRIAIDEDPQNADAHNNLAWLYYTKRENLYEAERLALKAIEISPSKREIYQDTLEKIRGLLKKVPHFQSP
jgi:tetratricopeptide (TPR) repeat protein